MLPCSSAPPCGDQGQSHLPRVSQTPHCPKARPCQWGKTETEWRESLAGQIADSLLHVAICPNLYLQHSVSTARGSAPGHRRLPGTLGPYQVAIGRYFLIFHPHVEPWLLQPRDMSTIIIITTITTNFHECISTTYKTGEKSWCALLSW